MNRPAAPARPRRRRRPARSNFRPPLPARHAPIVLPDASPAPPPNCSEESPAQFLRLRQPTPRNECAASAPHKFAANYQSEESPAADDPCQRLHPGVGSHETLHHPRDQATTQPPRSFPVRNRERHRLRVAVLLENVFCRWMRSKDLSANPAKSSVHGSGTAKRLFPPVNPEPRENCYPADAPRSHKPDALHRPWHAPQTTLIPFDPAVLPALEMLPARLPWKSYQSRLLDIQTWPATAPKK